VVRSEGPADRGDVRRHNLSLLLRLLAEGGPRSRAGLASDTGLTKATVSSLVSQLIDRGLVRDVGQAAPGSVGRPATLVEVDGTNLVTLGVELGVDYTGIVAADLTGRVIEQRRRPLSRPSVGPRDVVAALRADIRAATGRLDRFSRRVVGITVAVAGMVDSESGAVVFSPNLGWRMVPLRDELRRALRTSVPIGVENEANLGALAEFRLGSAAGTKHLVYVIVENGVGAGVIADGQLFRGRFGQAGEVGHTTVDPSGDWCACGNRGCWETTIGMRALLTRCVPDQAVRLLNDRRLGPEEKVAFVVARAADGDAVARSALADLGRWLGIGLANIVDVLDPEVLVLAGSMRMLAPWIHESAVTAMRARLPNPASPRVEVSTLGYSAAGLGAALLAAERLLIDPLAELVPTRA
jgi:predicted NBD/HSP70 family sugar kinase